MMEYKYEKLNDWHFNSIDNPIGYLVYTHLLIEHALNYIAFRNKFKNFEDLKFAQKVEKIFENQLIPEWIYFNLKKLNKLRNRLVHDLEIDFSKIDLEFKTLSGFSIPLNELIDHEEKDTITSAINIIGQNTLSPLNTLIVVEYL